MTTQTEWEASKRKKIEEFDSKHLDNMRNLVNDDPALSYFERHGEYYTNMPCTRGDAFENPSHIYGGHTKQNPDHCVQEDYYISADYGAFESQCHNRRGYGHKGLYCKQHAVIHPAK